MNGTSIIWSLIFSVIVVFGFYHREREGKRVDIRAVSPIIEPLYMPILFVILAVLLLFRLGASMVADSLLAAVIGVMIQATVYFTVLFLLMPILRKTISARVCASLWILPNVLYIGMYGFFSANRPALLIRIGHTLSVVLLIIWAAGFSAVLIWKIAAHVVYRKKILRETYDVHSGEIDGIWNDLHNHFGVRGRKYRLRMTDAPISPVTVGLFKSTMCVILPERFANADDAEMVLKHELVHILRGDTRTKLFLTLCTAVCWFAPLMWPGVRRASEDMELCCDEFVLRYASHDDRKRYAELLLYSASDERGFTTCLAANASSLRYRLRRIMEPGEKLLGAVVAGIMIFVLLSTYGLVAVAYNETTVGEAVGGAEAVENVWSNIGGSMANWQECADDELRDYISDLKIYTLSGQYLWPGDENELRMNMTGGGETYYVQLTDHRIYVSESGGDRYTKTYYVDGTVDWDYIASKLTLEAEKAPSMAVPEMYFTTDLDTEESFTLPHINSYYVGGEAREPNYNYDGECIFEGIELKRITFRFSAEPTELRIWALQNGEEIPLDSKNEIQCIGGEAEYHIVGVFEYESTSLEAEFILKVRP